MRATVSTPSTATRRGTDWHRATQRKGTDWHRATQRRGTDWH